MTSAEFSVEFPYVSKPIVPWPASASSNNSSSQNIDFPVLKPDQDPIAFFQTNNTAYLQPGATYYWKCIELSKPIHIYGQGATVQLVGPGPVFVFNSESVIPEDFYVVFENINFIEDEFPIRSGQLSLGLTTHSAVWFINVWKTSIVNCNFKNFRGAALWYSDNRNFWNARKWNQQHLVSNCRFNGCRIGISNTGSSEYSIASQNQFYDCQICFNVIGGNWSRNNNVIVNCRCAYLHVGDNMWYEGHSENNNPAKGTFCNNIINHADNGGNVWPTQFKLTDGSTIQLASFYFDDNQEIPPCYSGNFHWFGDVNIVNFSTTKIDKWCITGCNFYGNTHAANDAGQVQVAEAVKDKVFIIGCSGNNVTMKNIVEGNMTPKIGTIK